jgi:hypothetical protein
VAERSDVGRQGGKVRVVGLHVRADHKAERGACGCRVGIVDEGARESAERGKRRRAGAREVGQPIGRRGERAERIERRAATSAGGRQHIPGGAVVGVEHVLVGHPGEPALARHVEGPGAVLPGRKLAGLPDPGAGGAGGDDVADTVGGRGRRRGEVLVEDGLLDQRVERAHRLVVGDVLLRLRCHQEGELQVGRGIHRWRGPVAVAGAG